MSGWHGERCQELETQHCAQNPCQNDGKCVTLVGDFFCVCPEGNNFLLNLKKNFFFTGVNGKNCEIAPNRCIGEPCHNGGICGDFGSHQKCMCPKGYTGEGCQYKIDPCRSNLCKNGATCIIDLASNISFIHKDSLLAQNLDYKCICAPGFTGNECETNINECALSPCPLNSTCVDQLDSYYCQCPFNMTGINCDKKINPDYDFHFYDGGVGIQPSRASLSVPFKFVSNFFSLSVWVRFDRQNLKSTVLTLYNSQ